jgi:hypothetical protein
MSAMNGVLVVAAIFVVVVVLDGSSHGKKTDSSAYQHGYQTGVDMRNRAGLPLNKSSLYLLKYCRQAPYAKYIPTTKTDQWLAGYDAGCDGR